MFFVVCALQKLLEGPIKEQDISDEDLRLLVEACKPVAKELAG
jgi:hypothetical protein